MNIIGITMGDPKGIGPEIIAKAWKGLSRDERSRLMIYGDRAILNSAFELAGAWLNARQLVTTSSIASSVGKMEEAEAARASISAVDAAIEDISSGRIQALITAPINKRRIQAIREGFTGHTEYLAAAAKAKDVVMMFVAENPCIPGSTPQVHKHLCVSLTTMHLAIKDVPASITKERVLITIERTREALASYFSCPDARIAVMSLNPHAGEGGLMGTEEEEVIIPAVEIALEKGINCSKPISADALFRNLKDFDYDGVVAMYHDQGLLPIKTLFGGKCVNVTLGLPYIRTSPGHGTAEDIAWLGHADEGCMIATMKLTRRMTEKK